MKKLAGIVEPLIENDRAMTQLTALINQRWNVDTADMTETELAEVIVSQPDTTQLEKLLAQGLALTARRGLNN